MKLFSLFLCTLLVSASTLHASANDELHTLDASPLAKMQFNICRWTDRDLGEVLENVIKNIPSKYNPVVLVMASEKAYKAEKIAESRTNNLSLIASRVYNSAACKYAVPIPNHLIASHQMELDPGYGFHRIYCLEQTYLEMLHNLTRTSNRQIQTADVGAGFGWMASLALVSGGLFASSPKEGAHLRGVRVTAFESHPPLLGDKTKPGPVMQFFRQAKETSPVFNNSGARAADYSVVVAKDAVVALGENARANLFDCAYLGNMIHYLAPQRARLLAQNLMHALQPGGYVFASVHTCLDYPSINEHLKAAQTQVNSSDNTLDKSPFETPFDVYKKQCDSGADFPGWMILSISQHYTANHTHLDTTFTSAQSLDETQDTLSPVERHIGAFAKQIPLVVKNLDGTLSQKSYRSYQIYDSVSFKKLFTDAGFHIDDLFYTDSHGKRVETATIGEDGRFTNSEQTLAVTRVCVVARKSP